MTARPLITLTLRPEPGVDPTRALRRLLKFAARSCGLRCTRISCDTLPVEPAWSCGLQSSQVMHRKVVSMADSFETPPPRGASAATSVCGRFHALAQQNVTPA